MRVLRLAGARVLLWARDRCGDPFEVSKVVRHRLQPLCPSAPRCPDEQSGPFQRGGLGWVDPSQRPRGDCAYGFERRGECLSHRNQLALEAALFLPNEVHLTRRLLEALGYEVEEEGVDPIHERDTVLQAHGQVGVGHEVRLLHSPAAGPIVLVRPRESAQPRGYGAPLLRAREGARSP